MMIGKQMYDAFMLSVTPNPTMVYSLTAGPYYVEVNFCPPAETEAMKEDVLEYPSFDDWASSIKVGAKPYVLDMCGMGKEFLTGYESSGYEGSADDSDDEELSFDTLFPNCIPLAENLDISEFLFIDTRDDNYPVLFWNHECIVKVSKDFASFISTITPIT